ncbi:39S ribosomal protein L44, mitochondrial-like [Gigantopelta aegis]|uniref:39S ribosomal protein L44, mitochondrial-like n=1 Tax=Gigantopelta aegis TaxID=1735272 RepID=UPI001B887BE4|nr:39S ribosomal protein L44, mitochondrial-like [Gigantopelta aegis]
MAAPIGKTCLSCWKLIIRPSSRLLKEFRRTYKVWDEPVSRAFFRRREEAGPEPDRHRSEWINWNYEAEVFAFGKRLGEDFKEETLRRAFTHRSYIEIEEKRRTDLGIDLRAAPLGLTDNEELAEIGEETAERYIKAFLRHSYPRMFEEGICAISDYLTADEMLADIARNIGIADLMLCADFPPEIETLSKTFKAVVGALHEDQGQKKAAAFVRDFVLPQLIGKDINEMWNVVNPMGLLTVVLNNQGQEPPEPRLLWSSASQCMMSLYYVGIYSNKQLIAKAPGETVLIAEEMAARNALKKILGTADYRAPLPLGKMAENLNLDYDKKNISVGDITVDEHKLLHSAETTM